MVKKKICFVLLVALLALLFIPAPVFIAQAETSVTVSFELRVNNKNVVLVNKDDIISVDFVIVRTDANESYSTNGFQNEIHFDMQAFEFVEGSLVCYDTGMPTAKYQDNIQHGKIIQCANMANTYTAEFKFCSFQLKAKKDAVNGMVYNGNAKIYDAQHNPIDFAEKNLKVMIGIDCTHATQNSFAYTPSTCQQKGHQAYSECDVCGALFDGNDTLLAEVPYLPLDEHTGGTATCIDKATCSVCNTEYGEVDAHKHSNKTYITNQKEATTSELGYTGDKVCVDCDVVVEQGTIIPALSNDVGTTTPNITIIGDNNIVGENNSLTVNTNTNSTILIVGLSMISALLLGILLVLILFYVRSAPNKKDDDGDHDGEPTAGSDEPTDSDNQPEEVVDQQIDDITEVVEPVEASADTAGEADAPVDTQEPVIAEDPTVADETVATVTDELSIDDTAEEDTTTEVVEEGNTDTADKNAFAGIVKKPFEIKLAESSENVKRYYDELKDLLLSFKRVKSRLSIKYDTIYIGRQQLAKFVIRGKSLYLYLALDANQFDGTKFNVEQSLSKSYVATPCKYKVNGDRKFVWAKELILLLAKEYNLLSK